jgi:hypothetical protein
MSRLLSATASAISLDVFDGASAKALLYGNHAITQRHLSANRIDVEFTGIGCAIVSSTSKNFPHLVRFKKSE